MGSKDARGGRGEPDYRLTCVPAAHQKNLCQWFRRGVQMRVSSESDEMRFAQRKYLIT